MNKLAELWPRAREKLRDPIVLFRTRATEAGADLLGDRIRRVRLDDAAIVPDDVDDWQVRNPAAERETATFEVRHRALTEAVEGLGGGQHVLVAVDAGRGEAAGAEPDPPVQRETDLTGHSGPWRRRAQWRVQWRAGRTGVDHHRRALLPRHQRQADQRSAALHHHGDRRQAEGHPATGRRNQDDVERPAGDCDRAGESAGRLRAAVQPFRRVRNVALPGVSALLLLSTRLCSFVDDVVWRGCRDGRGMGLCVGQC